MPDYQRRQIAGVSLATACLTASRITAAQSGGQAGPSSVVDSIVPSAQSAADIPIRTRWPSTGFSGKRPLVLFSHGLGGTLAGGSSYGQAWVEAGFVVVHLQHPGSDLAAVRQAPRQAMAPEQLLNRVRDVKAVLDLVGQGGAEWDRVDSERIGFCGHSFGSRTTLAIAGEHYPVALADPRPKAFIAFSPFAGNESGEQLRQRFSSVVRPVLCVTGTLDGDVVNLGTTPEMRQSVYAALPPSSKAQLLLKDADHFTFAGQELPAGLFRRRRPDNALAYQVEHHGVLARLTTDWWLSQLAQDTAASSRLVRPLLNYDRGDSWQTK